MKIFKTDRESVYQYVGRVVAPETFGEDMIRDRVVLQDNYAFSDTEVISDPVHSRGGGFLAWSSVDDSHEPRYSSLNYGNARSFASRAVGGVFGAASTEDKEIYRFLCEKISELNIEILDLTQKVKSNLDRLDEIEDVRKGDV